MPTLPLRKSEWGRCMSFHGICPQCLRPSSVYSCRGTEPAVVILGPKPDQTVTIDTSSRDEQSGCHDGHDETQDQHADGD
jgi:hypothetical protein